MGSTRRYSGKRAGIRRLLRLCHDPVPIRHHAGFSTANARGTNVVIGLARAGLPYQVPTRKRCPPMPFPAVSAN
jgi:hypothetical protein